MERICAGKTPSCKIKQYMSGFFEPWDMVIGDGSFNYKRIGVAAYDNTKFELVLSALRGEDSFHNKQRRENFLSRSCFGVVSLLHKIMTR